MIILLIGVIVYCKLDERAMAQEIPYQKYHCLNFQIGDFVVADCPFDKDDPFVGRIKIIEPKPTNEKMHWITIENHIIFKTSTFSEDYVKVIKKAP